MSDEFLLGLSPINYVSPDHSPSLIVQGFQGVQDQRVPLSQGKSIYQALLKEGVQSKFVTIPGAGHVLLAKMTILPCKTINWLEEHLAKK